MNEQWEEDDDSDEKWECYLCCHESHFDDLPFGYLSNYHPLCSRCADKVLKDEDHKDRYRLTYHKSVGDLIVVANVPFKKYRAEN